MRAAVERVSARYSALDGSPPPSSPSLRGAPVVQTKEFLAAVADHGLVK
jgi:hypothetical protein